MFARFIFLVFLYYKNKLKLGYSDNIMTVRTAICRMRVPEQGQVL